MGLHEDTHSFWLPISLSCLSTSTSLLSLLEEFDGPSLERLLPHALQTLCTKNSSALSEIPRSLAISDSALEFLVQRVWRAWGRSLSREGPSNSSRRLRREVEVLRQEREIGSQKL